MTILTHLVRKERDDDGEGEATVAEAAPRPDAASGSKRAAPGTPIGAPRKRVPVPPASPPPEKLVDAAATSESEEAVWRSAIDDLLQDPTCRGSAAVQPRFTTVQSMR